MIEEGFVFPSETYQDDSNVYWVAEMMNTICG
jgi:hypothetical protein